VLAFRAASIYNTGEREFTYGFGGINQLRGYEFREFIGSRLVWSNLEFRFPLIDFMTFPLLGPFVIRGVVFLDAGAAWLDNENWYDPLTNRVRVRVGDPGDPLEPVKFRWRNKELDMMQDLRASWGAGFNLLLFRTLQLNWIWARPTEYAQYNPNTDEFEKVKSVTRQEFYIVYDW
jgi:outer membrane protein assembly factor BamA